MGDTVSSSMRNSMPLLKKSGSQRPSDKLVPKKKTVHGMLDSWTTTLSQNFAGVMSTFVASCCMESKKNCLCLPVKVKVCDHAHDVVCCCTFPGDVWWTGGCSTGCTIPQPESRQAITLSVFNNYGLVHVLKILPVHVVPVVFYTKIIEQLKASVFSIHLRVLLHFFFSPQALVFPFLTFVGGECSSHNYHKILTDILLRKSSTRQLDGSVPHHRDTHSPCLLPQGPCQSLPVNAGFLYPCLASLPAAGDDLDHRMTRVTPQRVGPPQR